MGFVEQMKWWHWVGLSLVLGALLAFLNSGGADTAIQHRSVSTVTFETDLLLGCSARSLRGMRPDWNWRGW